MENVGAVKELCKLTDNLENRIDELERMNRRLAKLKGLQRVNSLSSSVSNTTTASSIATISRSASSVPPNKGTRRDPSKSTTAKQEGIENPLDLPKAPWPFRLWKSGSSSTLGKTTNPRMIHVTILALVLVMCFCLVSITVLYILEKHKPAHSHPHIMHPVPDNTTASSRGR